MIMGGKIKLENKSNLFQNISRIRSKTFFCEIKSLTDDDDKWTMDMTMVKYILW